MVRNSFTAFDVETANRNLSSICSIGIVRFEHGELVDKIHYLIRPPENCYEFRNIEIHGITPDKTEKSPIFSEVWALIKHYFQGQLVVAHNISFDRSALKRTLEHYSFELPEFEEVCTYKLSGLKLDTACNSFNIDLNHHNSLSDAEACAKLYLKLLNGLHPIVLTISKEKDYKSSTPNYHEKIRKENTLPDLENSDTTNPFYGQNAVISGLFENFTRNELAVKLCSFGCSVSTNIVKKTRFLIIGKDYGPAKYQLAKIEGLKIIAEDELLTIFDNVRKPNVQTNDRGVCGDNLFQGLTFVVSGVFTNFSRDEIKAAIEKHGGKNTSSVSGSTDFLVAGENMGPAKRQKAEALGVKIISEAEFMEMIGLD